MVDGCIRIKKLREIKYINHSNAHPIISPEQIHLAIWLTYSHTNIERLSFIQFNVTMLENFVSDARKRNEFRLKRKIVDEIDSNMFAIIEERCTERCLYSINSCALCRFSYLMVYFMKKKSIIHSIGRRNNQHFAIILLHWSIREIYTLAVRYGFRISPGKPIYLIPWMKLATLNYNATYFKTIYPNLYHPYLTFVHIRWCRYVGNCESRRTIHDIPLS